MPEEKPDKPPKPEPKIKKDPPKKKDNRPVLIRRLPRPGKRNGA